MTKTISRDKLVIIILTLIIISMSIFFYFYLTKQNPLESITQPVHSLPQGLFAFGNDKQTGLLKPLGVGVDGNKIIVADSAKHRLVWFDRNGKKLKSVGSFGNGPDKFNYPVAVAAGAGKIFVADLNNNRIVVLDQEGKYLESWPRDSKNNLRPVALALNSKGLLYVSDLLSQQVLVLDEQGRVVKRIGEPGSGERGLSYANGIALNEDESLLIVADSNNGRLQVFNADDGKHVKTIKEGIGFVLPRGITFDRERNAWIVVDTMQQAVIVLDANFKPIGQIAGFKEGDPFRFPNGVATDGTGRIYITDRENDRIVVLK
ncbi:Sugar lactone lactonase YvrE [Carboxydocella sporoproducens DSM 16521]|uniref:Sugar lactone lactonase YvrE n=2 Tax=Carboxydocella TaxID=178898 RepID=A0A1T4RC58_9FIRM|nr:MULTISPECIES: 6-bladed beta-propeller [Carboxydocella]AVX20873.1 Sugar lactone lactonase YvrE [Carboxydocella thermautotrophica]SKA13509.1 Sugar lactone lactonase YvrE [Carboxydocella sporoproducens DSM 16521]